MNAHNRLFLLAVCVGGFFLRLHDLGKQSFWLDEAYTWGVAVNTTWLNVWQAMLLVSDVSPLPYVLSKLGVPILTSTEFGMRFPSAVFGWLAIPVMYRLGRAMFGASEALLAAAFIALSPFAVWYSRDARPYGLYLVLSAVALWGFHRAARGHGWGVFVMSSAALYLTHYVSALFVYAQAAYLVARMRESRRLFRRWALAQLLAVVPVGAWIIAFLVQHRQLTGNSWIPPVTALTPLYTIWNFASGDAGQSWVGLTGGILVICGLIGWGLYRTPKIRSATIHLLLWWLLLPLAAGWLLSLRLPVYIDRFFEPAILSIALLLARGISLLPKWLRWTMAIILGVSLLGASMRLISDPQFAKEDWRGLTSRIQSLGLPVGVADAESLLGVTPYLLPGDVQFEVVRSGDDLTEKSAEGRFVMIWRSPHESAHALSKSAPFDPLTESPEFFRRWLEENPAMPISVYSFTGLALVVIG
jgi:4-amino-4-deoxy-L-arabinose transferase-like glycosyltransferase